MFSSGMRADHRNSYLYSYSCLLNSYINAEELFLQFISGLDAAHKVIAEGRKVAPNCNEHLKAGLLRDCDDAEHLCKELEDLAKKGQVCSRILIAFVL